MGFLTCLKIESLDSFDFPRYLPQGSSLWQQEFKELTNILDSVFLDLAWIFSLQAQVLYATVVWIFKVLYGPCVQGFIPWVVVLGQVETS